MPTNAVPIRVAVVGIMGNAKKCEKNAKKYNFLAFFFKNIWWFDIFSVILRRFHNI